MEKHTLKKILFEQSEFISCCRDGLFWQGAIASTALLDTFFSWGELNSILTSTRITRDRLRLSTKDAQNPLNQKVFRAGRDALGRATEFLSVNDLHELLQQGATGIVEALDEVSPTLADFAGALTAQYGARSSANAYISFGDVPGFGVHYDDHDIIVMQIAGQKKWRFFEHQILARQPFPLPKRTPVPTHATEEITLTKGHVLFIPKGTWHEAVAMGEPSLHITFSLVYPRLQDYIEWLLKRGAGHLNDDIKSATQEELEGIASKGADFFSQVINEASLAQFLQIHRSLYAANQINVALPSLNRVSLEEKFCRVPQHIIDLHTPDDNDAQHVVTALGKKYILDPYAYRVLTKLSNTQALTGIDLCLQLEVGSAADTAWEGIAPALENLLKQGLVSKK